MVGIFRGSLVSDKSLKGFYESNTSENYDSVIFSIQSEIDKNPSQIFHLIIYGHGRKDRIIHLGKDILPESIFEHINRPQAKIVMSVVSCYAGRGIKDNNLTLIKDGEATTPTRIKLCESHLMVIYAGKRVTISSTDTSKVLNLIKSHNFIPQLLFSNQDGLTLSSPETTKIVTDQNVTKFSPLKIFKTNPRPKIKEIAGEAIDQQNKINRIFEDYLGEEFSKNFMPRREYVVAENLNIMSYLRDLAFLIILTKCGEKIDYLRYLVDEMGVDPSTFRSIHEEKHFLIIDACTAGNLEAVKFLVDRKVQLGVANDFGVTPLMAACYKGRDEVVTYLSGFLTKNQINQKDNFGESILTIVNKSKCSASTVKLLLEKAGAE